MQDKDERKVNAQIRGRTEGPFGSDDTDVDLRDKDNKHRKVVANSANGLDSVQVRSGQDGYNIRGVDNTDMDSKHVLLRGATSWHKEYSAHGVGESQTQVDKDIAETGTDLENQPPY
jgi:hypothetical protein